MQPQALRIVFAAALLLTLPLAAQLSFQAAELRNSAASALVSTQTSVRAASYRSDIPDTGPPSPGPTDPNGPSS